MWKTLSPCLTSWKAIPSRTPPEMFTYRPLRLPLRMSALSPVPATLPRVTAAVWSSAKLLPLGSAAAGAGAVVGVVVGSTAEELSRERITKRPSTYVYRQSGTALEGLEGRWQRAEAD